MSHETVNVTALELAGGHRVRPGFDDGATRERDLLPLLTGPVFDAIRAQPAEFAKAFIDPDDDLWEEATRLARSA